MSPCLLPRSADFDIIEGPFSEVVEAPALYTRCPLHGISPRVKVAEEVCKDAKRVWYVFPVPPQGPLAPEGGLM